MQNSNMFTRTISRTPVLGEREVCFRSPKLYQHSPIVQQCRIQKFTRGQNHAPRTFVLGEGKFFRSPKMYLNSTTTMQNSNFVPEQYSGHPFQRRRMSVLFSKHEINSPTVMPNSKISRGTIPRTFVLGERNVCFRSPKMYQNSPI